MNNTNDKYCTFYIVRHGETIWNIKKFTQGHGDSPLTENGIKQANQLADTLKKTSIHEIFSSDLPRAIKTAEIIAQKHKLQVKTDKSFRERNYGKFEGKPMREYTDQLKDLLIIRDKLDNVGQFKFKLSDDIESDEEIVNRFVSSLNGLAKKSKGRQIVIVTHGGIMRILLVYLGYGTRKEIASSAVKNSGYIKLDSDGNNLIIRETYDIEKRSDE